MDTADRQDESRDIDDFAQMVSCIWEVNELITRCEYGQIGLCFNKLSSLAKKTAACFEMSELDVVLMGLEFFGRFAGERGINISPNTETITLIAAQAKLDA